MTSRLVKHICQAPSFRSHFPRPSPTGVAREGSLSWASVESDLDNEREQRRPCVLQFGLVYTHLRSTSWVRHCPPWASVVKESHFPPEWQTQGGGSRHFRCRAGNVGCLGRKAESCPGASASQRPSPGAAGSKVQPAGEEALVLRRRSLSGALKQVGVAGKSEAPR